MSTGDSYTPQDQNIDNIGLLNSPSSATPVAQPTKISLPEDMVQMNNNLYPNEDRDPNRQDNYQVNNLFACYITRTNRAIVFEIGQHGYVTGCGDMHDISV